MMRKISFVILSLVFVLVGFNVPKYVCINNQHAISINSVEHNMVVEYDDQDKKTDEIEKQDNTTKTIVIAASCFGGAIIAGLVFFFIIKSKKS